MGLLNSWKQQQKIIETRNTTINNTENHNQDSHYIKLLSLHLRHARQKLGSQHHLYIRKLAWVPTKGVEINTQKQQDEMKTEQDKIKRFFSSFTTAPKNTQQSISKIKPFQFDSLLFYHSIWGHGRYSGIVDDKIACLHRFHSFVFCFVVVVFCARLFLREKKPKWKGRKQLGGIF